MKYIYFHDVQTVEELKRQYKTLAFKYHPDREGGSKEIMQQVNAEYDDLLARVRNVHETADGQTYTRETAEDIPDDFRKIIDAIINFDCRIELCGSWLWVFGASIVGAINGTMILPSSKSSTRRTRPMAVLSEEYDGKERHKALKRFEELKKQYPNIETEIDIAKGKWEK